MLTLWGRTNSINVQKALFALEDLELPYERIEAGANFGVTNTPAYRAMNPNGLVPTLRDGEFILWESNAIVRYLAANYGAGRLAPADPKVWADADRWMDWSVTALTLALVPAFHGLVRSPGVRSQAEIDGSIAATEAAMAILEAHLESRHFLAGEHYTMADGAVGASVHRWLNMPVPRSPLPAVEAWYARLMERSAARKVLLLPIT